MSSASPQELFRYAAGALSRLLISPAHVAKSAAARAEKMMNAKAPEHAIQECIVGELEAHITSWAGTVFAQRPNTWPSTKAFAYDQIYQEVEKIGDPPLAAAARKLVLKFITEQIGIEGSKYAIRQGCGSSIPDAVFEVFHGPHVVNVYVVDPAGHMWVGEAKGGSSQLKGDQGTLADLKRVAKEMKNSNFETQKYLFGETPSEQQDRSKREQKRRQDAGEAIEDAIAHKRFTYLAVQTPANPLGDPVLMKDPVEMK